MIQLRQTFQALVDETYDDIHSYVSYLTGGSSQTEDMVHEAFLLAFKKLSQGDAFSGEPRMWLRGTVRKLVHVHWRKVRRLGNELAESVEAVVDEADDVIELALQRESSQALQRCMQKLPEKERTLIGRRYEQDAPIHEIAGEMGINVSTLRVRLFRIRDALRACVERALPPGSPNEA
jgi:RNA polymerase sigma-70 factor (ECF subfamily)